MVLMIKADGGKGMGAALLCFWFLPLLLCNVNYLLWPLGMFQVLIFAKNKLYMVKPVLTLLIHIKFE